MKKTGILLSGVTIDAEVAQSTEELKVGLSSKESLGEKEGMLFDFGSKGKHCLGMVRGMSFPIDTIFLNEHGEVVQTDTLNRSGEETAARSRYAIEVPAGFCDKNGVSVGDTASFSVTTDTTEKRNKSIESALRRLRTQKSGTPEGVPEGYEYVSPDNTDDLPEEADVAQGPGGGTYAPSDVVDTTTDEEESEEESDGSDDPRPSDVVPGEQRTEIDGPEDAQEVIEDFDEDDYEWSHWEQNDENITEGTIVEVQTGDFQLPGDGEIAVAADEDMIVTADGEANLMADSYMGADDNEVKVLSTWNDPANEVALGERSWDNVAEESIPDGVEVDEGESEEEEEETNEAPYWSGEVESLEDITESEAPEGGLSEGVFLQEDGVVQLEEDTDYEGDVPVYEAEGRDGKAYSQVGDTLTIAGGPNDIRTGEVQYIDFAEDSEYESGWYQTKDDYAEFEDEDGSTTVGFELYSEEHGQIDLQAGEELRENVHGVHTPRENSYGAESLEAPPEPSGSKDPSDWTIDWGDRDDSKTGEVLSDAQKQLMMREWKAAVDDEAFESVSNTIRSVKDSTYNTEGQKYDRLAQELMDASGDPRSGDFDDAEEPTEEEIEAMEVFQEASREFFDRAYGDSKDIHRGLADYSHERVLPQLKETFESDEDLSGKDVVLSDNPASVWTTEENAANTFTVVGGTSKSIVVEEEVGQEDVFAMPDAIYPYEEREEVGGEDSDWDEGEINIPGNGRELDPDSVKVVNAQELKDDGSIHEASLTDVIDDPASVIEGGNPGSIERFLKTLDGLGDEEFYNAYVSALQAEEGITEMEGWDMIEERIQSIEERGSDGTLFSSAGSEKQSTGEIVIDFDNPEDGDWLKTEGVAEEDKIARKAKEAFAKQRNPNIARKAAKALFEKTPQGVPDTADYVEPDKEPPGDATVHEGPGGGTYVTYPDETDTDDSEDDSDGSMDDDGGDIWSPYIGSKGHEGWINQEGTVVESKRPPGELVSSSEEIPEEMREAMAEQSFYNEVDDMILDRIENEIENADAPAFDVPEESEEWLSIGELPDGMDGVEEGGVVQYRGEQYKVEEIREESGATVWVGESPDGREEMRRVEDPRNHVIQDTDEIPEYPELEGEWVPAASEYGRFDGWENVETGEYQRGATPPGEPVLDPESIPDEIVFEMSDRAGFGTSQQDVREQMREDIEQIQRFNEYGQEVVEAVDASHLDLEDDITDYDPSPEDVDPGDTIVTEGGHTSAVKAVTDDGVIAERIDTGYSTDTAKEVDPVAIVEDVELSGDTTAQEVEKHLKSRVDNVEDINQSGFREQKMNELVADEVGRMMESGVSGRAIFDGLQNAVPDLNNLQTSNYIDYQTARTELDLDAVDGTVEFFAQDDEMDSELVKIGKSFGEENPDLADFASETFEGPNGMETSFEDAVDTWSFENAMEGAAPMWAIAVEKFGASIDDVPDRVFGQGSDVERDLDMPDEVMDKIGEYVEYQQEMLREVFGDEIPVYRGMSGDHPEEMKENAEETGEASVDHRAIESWSLSPTQASGFAETRGEEGDGAMIETTVPVENVLLSGLDNVGLESELEIVAFKEDGTYDKLGEEDLDSDEQNDGVYFTSEVGEETEHTRRNKKTTHGVMADKATQLYERVS